MECNVVFINYDGKLLYETVVRLGETAVYQGKIPSKPDEKFVGWDKSLENIRENLIVKPIFEKVKKGNFKLGALSFVENNKHIHVIESAVIRNNDLLKENEKENER